MVEMLTAVVIIGILATIVLSKSSETRDLANVQQAIIDIGQLQALIDDHAMTAGQWPATLADVGKGGAKDPWGLNYRYRPFADGIPENARRDRFLVPLNTTYDLFSRGKDGVSSQNLNNQRAQDDIVRCNDGAFVGLGSHY